MSELEIENARLANSVQLRLNNRVPAELLTAIARSNEKLHYSSASHVFIYLPAYGVGDYVGVFGDGENGCYEWFIWFGANLKTSDVGFGDVNIALRDVLNKLTEEGYL